MRQIWISRIGDPSVLEVREAPDPTPAAGQIRIAVEASGVNFADLMARSGMYPDAPPVPCVVGYEVAGVIDAIGEGVDESRMGEAVLAPVKFGGYSTSVCCDAIQAVRRPEGLGAVEAASIPIVGLTAWMTLEKMGRIREGDRVLVHSAGGGVGLMALELLKYRNCTAIGTASKGKHEFLLERGYDQLIDYRNDDFEAILKDNKVDLILDPIGGASWAKGMRVLRMGGRIVCFGVSTMITGNTRNVFSAIGMMIKVPWLKFNPMALMNENKGVMGVNLAYLTEDKAFATSMLVELMERYSEGAIRTHVHATVPFDNAPEAHRILHDRENLGKVVLVP